MCGRRVQGPQKVRSEVDFNTLAFYCTSDGREEYRSSGTDIGWEPCDWELNIFKINYVALTQGGAVLAIRY